MVILRGISKRACQMLSARTLPAVVVLGASLFATAALSTEAYPSKPIKLVVPLAAGGPPDVMARLTAPALSARLGQSVIVENRVGGGGTIGTKQVATAAPDGYTLLFSGSNFALGPAFIRHLGYRSIEDFVPIATVASGSWILVVSPSVPARSVKELIEYAKANPGKLNWGFSINTGPTLLGEMFMAATGIKVARISYKGGPQAVTDLLGGHVHMNFSVVASVLPLVREGKLRALAVTSEARSPDLPDVPTMSEVGLTRLTRGFWTAILGPAQTPAAIVNTLNAAVNASLATPEMQASLAKLGYVPKPGSPRDFAALLSEEINTWQEAAKVAGILPQ
jgi:tripartite-type tricarboxylate transporter receptor subunit TctC